jgi:hypothetical protein
MSVKADARCLEKNKGQEYPDLQNVIIVVLHITLIQFLDGLYQKLLQ